jgi:hypothetical protein
MDKSETTPASSGDGENDKDDTTTAKEDPDLTLAQQIAENERQMYEKSQKMIEEIENEVLN